MTGNEPIRKKVPSSIPGRGVEFRTFRNTESARNREFFIEVRVPEHTLKLFIRTSATSEINGWPATDESTLGGLSGVPDISSRNSDDYSTKKELYRMNPHKL